MIVIIGKIDKGEKRKKFKLNIVCSCCKTRVPGGMQTSEKYYGTDSFKEEIKIFKKNYLCGKCRDAKRIKDKKKAIS